MGIRSRWSVHRCACRSGCLELVASRQTRSFDSVSKTNGGLPPFGHATQLRVFVDPDLLQHDEVWAGVGTWNDNFGAGPADTVRVAGGVVTDFKR
ncbi:MAG: YbaK/EbsC family protein [Actinomycetes bacterium]